MNNKTINMYKFFLAFLLAIASIACENTNHREKEANTAQQTNRLSDAPAQPMQQESFYKRLEGTVGGKEIVLNVSKYRNSILINYYYKEQGQLVNLYLNRDTVLQNDSIELIEYNTASMMKEEENTRWRLLLTANGAHGRWRSADGHTQYDVVLKEHYPEGSYLFNVAGITDSATITLHHYTLIARSEEMMLEPADAAIASGWLKNGLQQTFWADEIKTEAKTVLQSLQLITKNFLDTYMAEIDSMRQSQDLDDTTRYLSLNYENITNANLIYNDNNFAVLNLTNYYYTGGAHGMNTSGMMCYDFNEKKVIALKDIVNIDSLSLQNLIEKQFRRTNNMKSNRPLTDILFENKLPANENFYFTSKGIGFVYQPYEVAAYAYGVISVFVPFTELKQSINPAFAQRMGL